MKVFYGFKPWFEVMGVFVVVFAFSFFLLFLCLFCLNKSFSMIWMMDGFALC